MLKEVTKKEEVVTQTKRSIGKTLVEAGRLSSEELRQAEEEARQKNLSLDEVLIRNNFISQEERGVLLADQMGVLYVDLENYLVDPAAIALVSEAFAKKHSLVPLFRIGNTLTVAMANPQDVLVIDDLRQKTKCEIEPCYTTVGAIQNAIDQYYGVSGSLEELIKDIDREKLAQEAQRKGRTPEQIAEEAPIIKLVNMIVMQAIRDRASDIHVEPAETVLRIRYRIDGILHEIVTTPLELQPPIVSRIKILSKMDIAEKRIPQDGRFQMKSEGKEIDLRVSSFPTVYGENVVMRLLDRSNLLLSLEDIGFPTATLKNYNQLIHRPYGIILVTGPTGSGKTTTLYATLQAINTVAKNIVTIEDPVEYHLELVRQCQVNPKVGLTFANGLRSIVRQDPDIVMVGEIRDMETAEIAIHAALTGQLVFSTLHTNDAPSAVTRLVDMGIEPFLLSSSVVGVLAQRLVRIICLKCKASYTPPAELLKELNLPLNTLFYRGKGCSHCKNTGYRGRLGIFQLMLMTAEVRELILKNSSADQIRKEAHRAGMITLRDDGLDKARQGITTVEEVLRVTQEV
ncbi:MAG: Flp pilus assembly complex ATPase component TadA [Candidatus Omnitrophica bacterium]|nr:Flp pilus assembly complex ATPase component TadA [Candidatus Omnitrophota bacterium]